MLTTLGQVIILARIFLLGQSINKNLTREKLPMNKPFINVSMLVIQNLVHHQSWSIHLVLNVEQKPKTTVMAPATAGSHGLSMIQVAGCPLITLVDALHERSHLFRTINPHSIHSNILCVSSQFYILSDTLARLNGG